MIQKKIAMLRFEMTIKRINVRGKKKEKEQKEKTFSHLDNSTYTPEIKKKSLYGYEFFRSTCCAMESSKAQKDWGQDDLRAPM